MKKIRSLAIIVVAILMACTFVACKDKKNEEATVYDTLNTLLGKVSYPFTVTTKVTEDGEAFNGTYTATESSGTIGVSYSYEKLSTFETVDGKLVAPADYKTTAIGSVKIKDGKVIEQNGAESNLSAEAFNVSGITLNENALTDIQTEEGKFTAKASSLSSLTGMDITAENIIVTVNYSAEKITELKLTYSTSSCQTEITYAFN